MVVRRRRLPAVVQRHASHANVRTTQAYMRRRTGRGEVVVETEVLGDDVRSLPSMSRSGRRSRVGEARVGLMHLVPVAVALLHPLMRRSSCSVSAVYFVDSHAHGTGACATSPGARRSER